MAFNHRNRHCPPQPGPSGYTFRDYKEIDDFEIAIRESSNRIKSLEDEIRILNARRSLLQSIHAEKVFKTPSEYDKFQESESVRKTIEARRKEIQDAKDKAIADEAKKVKGSQDFLIGKLPYYQRCRRYNWCDEWCVDDKHFEGCPPDYTEEDIRVLTPAECLEVGQIMSDAIRETHKYHIDKLRTAWYAVISCPFKCCEPYCQLRIECGDAHRTTGCGTKVYYDYDKKGITIDDKELNGYWARK